ncbi:UDP-N-acetylglucosamine--N-acetylmuramyl-(pentapeptide) pyrophosphoryl-undecaprenol N-acetylglucosamine transferase [Litorihabitans aurantiacus]|uniref:UDP-N-acetylglucosamine--N-acetylmuramyl-(pentapeptide) pyrophosphoryl-undecaprenol N-acetylglucosamine transferase n=1 Tax=Litorihabitans aurantiacus TaxID=1930061 RepID=A0AA38CP64_9MICO|nr:UDP-N-acetylglucosamine--N-acetylmuramyl-(pentapeptide) pyrophosphoryl-undecaprenol N-acetylglucosamine transferase [Litorihabitans aurantiacus]GMA31718.1 UDP-N-acetylglucosamine--N-acetylmuramyl-(pentapeptide) pyrophosphoryl-undecaprenol N-acetylglucosamine transferase [Litorihabitans aurantiacus]
MSAPRGAGPLRVLLAGGGTAGHVNPLLALADELRSRDAATEIVVLGTAEGLEQRLVPQRGYELATIPRVPFPRRPDAAALRFPRAFTRAVGLTGEAIARVDADVVVGFGGYVATPAYRAAARAGLPVVIHEQNVRAGLANRLGARRAAVVALTFAETSLTARRGRTVHTGLPLRPALADLARRRVDAQQSAAARREAAARLGLDADRPVLLVTGGSLGAQRINEALAGTAADLTKAGVQVLHAAGRGKDDAVRPAAEAAGSDYHLVPYLDAIEDAYACADLVVGRSGAGTVGEQAALGLPGVYVPLPIGNGEQRLNVRGLERAGGALVVDDAALTPAWLREHVLPLVADTDRLAAMGAAARTTGIADGAARLADLVRDAAGRATTTTATSDDAAGTTDSTTDTDPQE